MLFFTEEKIKRHLEEIEATIHREVIDIPRFRFIEADPPNAHAPDFDDSAWDDFAVGGYWGGYDVVAWFRATIAIPPAWRDQKVVLRFLTGPRDGYGSTAEALLYANGEPLQAIDVWHTEAWLPPELLAKDSLPLALRVWSSVLKVPPRRHFKLAQITRVDPDAEHLYYTAKALFESAQQLDTNDWRRVRLLDTVNRALDQIDFVQPRSEAYYDTLAAARAWLDDQVAALAELEPDERKPVLHAVGHSHIDMAWLWRLKHTREKAGRTFTTMLHLMRQYPDFRFVHTSPQLYAYLKHDFPAIFARVKERIAAGQWEITGGMWIEPDVNLPSGESLVRQFLLGRRFMREEFGVETTVLWLPDVFGYCWALPQIAAGAGITTFITAKMGGNQFARIPHDTFEWRGPDGSSVTAYFVTTHDPERPYWHATYNGTLSPYQVKAAWDDYAQKTINHRLLTPFGWGDGGGGPTVEMIETGRALENVPGIPRIQFDTVEHFCQQLATDLDGQTVPVWDGELFLQNHRGVFSSQAYVKKANRQAEHLYHEAEWLSALADVLTGARHYPAAALRSGWEKLLLNQFHDILCGTSIKEAHDDSRADYADILATGQRALDDAQARLVAHLAVDQPSVLVFNALGWPRDDYVAIPWQDALHGKTVATATGDPALVQEIEQDGRHALLLDVRAIPPLGYCALPLVDRAAPPQDDALIVTPDVLENAFWRLSLNEQGQIASLYDKQAASEILTAPGNVLQAFKDTAIDTGDAWNVEIYSLDRWQIVSEVIERTVEETGPLRGVLRLTWRFYDSTITQRLTIYRHHPRIDFRTTIDWHEKQVMLKAAFPVDVRARHATYDGQFGPVTRTTHRNTAWDLGHFEALVHKWADLSEGNHGVALLNDCKYGMDIHDNVMRLTLLRSPMFPDASADLGGHTFTYSLLPHADEWRAANVHRAGYALNVPLRAAVVSPSAGGTLPPQASFAQVDTDHVVIETVKRAEDDPAAWIVRVYETKDHRSSRVTLTFGQAIQRAVACNLVEEDDQPVSFAGNQLRFAIRARQIKTFKVWF